MGFHAKIGSGDVVGPASATDNAVVRFDLTTGKLLQGSPMTISDAGTSVSAVLTATGGAVTMSHDGSNGQISTATGFFIVNGMTGSALRHGGTTVITATTGGGVSTVAAPTNTLLRFGATGTTGHSLSGNDVLFAADIEVDGVAYLDGGSLTPSDVSTSFGGSSEMKIQWSTADDSARSARIGLPNGVGASANLGMIWIGSQADVIGTDLGIETGDSYGIVILQEGGAFAAGLAPVDGVATVFGVGTKSFQMLNPASGVVFSIISAGTATTITPESGTLLTIAGILNAPDGLRTKVSTADISTPPTDAELDSAFGAPATVGAGFEAFVNDNAGGTAMYHVASDGAGWFYTLMTKAV